MSATVSSINAPHKNAITPLGGLCSYGDHTIPAGYTVVELKVCENCGSSFMRKSHTGLKYCGHCRSISLMPPNQEEYREQLPTAAQMHHRTHLPHYDNSLLPKEPKVEKIKVEKIDGRHNPRRRYLKPGWREKLFAAFVDKPHMTAEDIQNVLEVPGAPYYTIMLIRARTHKFPIEVCGNMPPTGLGGRPPRIYKLQETSIQ